MKFKHRFFRNHLDAGEIILDVWHRHILVLKIDSIKIVFFGILLPILGYFIVPKAILAFAIWLTVGLIGLIYRFFDWYFDAWVLTNTGVIDIEYNGLFDMTSTRIEYHMIEGISYTIKGVLQTMFNYGEITIDKLGAQTSVVLKDARSPKKLERLVMKYQEKYVYDRSVRDHNALKGMLSEMIAYHVQNNKIDISKRD